MDEIDKDNHSQHSCSRCVCVCVCVCSLLFTLYGTVLWLNEDSEPVYAYFSVSGLIQSSLGQETSHSPDMAAVGVV